MRDAESLADKAVEGVYRVAHASGKSSGIRAEELCHALGTVEEFLYTLSADDRRIFMCRYWGFAPVAEIARKLGCPQSKVKSSLHRTRGKLQKYLTKEGLI